MKYYTYYYSLISGFLGASASCFAKLAFDTTALPAALASSTGGRFSGVAVVDSHFSTRLCHNFIRRITISTTTPVLLSSMTNHRFDHALWNDPNVICELSIFVTLRCMCIIGMISCNVYMIGTFLKGMDESGTIAGTALSTSSNFVASAMYGYLIWEERYTTQWWIGFTMVCVGMTILTQCCSANIEKRHQKNDTPFDRVKTE